MNNNIHNIFFSLVRVALGVQTSLAYSPSMKEWSEIFQVAKMQTMLGICFYGIQQLPREEVVHLKTDRLFIVWLGLVAQVQQRNEKLNQKCQEITHTLQNIGCQRCCILKGQGIAQSYSLELRNLRQPGDIDVWIDTDLKILIQKLKSIGEIESIGDHHVNLHTEDDIEIEYHYTPCTLHNYFSNKRIQKWMFSMAKEQFINSTKTNDGNIFCIPTLRFNLIFLMAHMHRHFFGEGLGMRQIVDYYFILKSNKGLDTVEDLLKDFSLLRFSKGLMWIMQEIFFLDKDYLVCKPNKKMGKFILKEILNGGNFGQYDETRRPTDGASHWRRFTQKIMAGGRYFKYFPSEFFWTPVAYAKEYVLTFIYR